MARKMKRLAVWISVCLCFIGMIQGMAAGGEAPLHTDAEGDRIVLYVSDPGESPKFQCQIGTQKCEKVSGLPIQEDAVPMETVFLVDNSLSVSEKYRPMAAEIMTQMAAGRMNGEVFSVYTFSDQIQALLEKSGDYARVKQAIESIQYQDQETYLTDVLYELLGQLSSEPGHLKRILIFSDGVDNKAIGITKEELYSAMEENAYPIYTFGCGGRNNAEELKNMFALSRMTGGESWMLDDVSDADEVIPGVSQLNKAWKVTIEPEPSELDGTKKGVSLTIISGGERRITTEVRMPFAAVGEGAAQESATTAAEKVTETERSTEAAVDPVTREKVAPPYALIAAGIAAVLGICVGVLFFMSKKKKKEVFQAAPPTSITGKASGSGGTQASGQSRNFTPGQRNTVMADPSNKPGNRKRETSFSWGGRIRLIDRNNSARVYEAEIGANPVIIGYNQTCQIRIDEDTVSGEHCQIQKKQNRYYISNLSNTNRTRVSGIDIYGETELKSGDILTIGNCDLKVEING